MSSVPPAHWSAYFREVAHKCAEQPSYAHSVRQSADAPDAVPGFVSRRIAILRNTTVELWLPELFTALRRRGVKASFQVGDYSAY